MKSTRPIPDLLRDTSASQIAEAAVILPMLFMLLLSIYWFGRAYSIYGTINHAAREGVRMAAVPVCANCDPPCSWAGSAFPCDDVVADKIQQVLQAANLDPAQIQAAPPNPLPGPCPDISPPGACTTASPGKFTICRNVVLNPNSTAPVPPICGAIISFQYPYQFTLPFTSLNNQGILIRAQAQLGAEN